MGAHPTYFTSDSLCRKIIEICLLSILLGGIRTNLKGKERKGKERKGKERKGRKTNVAVHDTGAKVGSTAVIVGTETLARAPCGKGLEEYFDEVLHCCILG